MTQQQQQGGQQDAGSGGNTGDDGQQQQGSQQQQSGGTGDDGQQQQQQSGQQQEQTRTLTQTELDAIIEGRLGRARESWKSEQAEAERQAKLTAEEQANERAQQAEADGKAAIDKAKGALARSAAQTIAAAEGGRPDRIAAIVQHADLADAEVDDDLNVTKDGTRAIKAAVKQVLKDFPEWATASGAPGEHNTDNTGGTQSLESQIAAAREKGDWRQVEKLRQRQLRESGQFKIGA